MTALSTALREQLKQGRLAIVEQYLRDRRPERLLKHIARNADQVLTQAWQQLGMPPSATLVAVGGYRCPDPAAVSARCAFTRQA